MNVKTHIPYSIAAVIKKCFLQLFDFEDDSGEMLELKMILIQIHDTYIYFHKYVNTVLNILHN